jgi:simple sugar transport system ATP-binding protein
VENDYIVEMRHITKRFGGVAANDDISIGIRRGEIFAVLGENGAGKSTLMSILFGKYEPDSGDILVRGRPAVLSSSNDAVSLNIGMVHQHFNLVPNYTVAENIILGSEPIKRVFGIFPCVDIKTAEARIAELSRAYGLEVDPSLPIAQAGVSVQQRVEILKMLCRNAEILIFDEPTAVLAPREIEFLLDIIRGLREKGHTIILITHKLEEIMRVADRCAVLRRGRLVGTLAVADTSPQELAELMVGRELPPAGKRPSAGFGDTVLEVQDLTVRDQDGLEVVKGVSFSVRRGEIFAIVGVSGSGQVEIADAIAGLARPQAGRIRLMGLDITDCGIRRRIEAGISYIPEDRQRYGVILDFTLAENLAIKSYYRPPLSKSGVLRPGRIREFADDLIERYDIRGADGAGMITRSMSGGNQQKAIIARELSRDSALIIFVQPTRGLDIGAIRSIHARIIEERDRGRAVLLVSLDLDEVMNLADTVGIVFSGRMVKISPANRLTADEVGEYMMGVRV